ncbi:(2Fe-2S)-binding protein [Inquilinus sp. CA228]|uniref:(2Fe-2S)-binding protein n=1 Tax=Inquilinus sp. CA228 TaxID=3455609 RepID=UPI003F8D8D7D
MYICICNALNDTQIRCAVDSGAKTAGQVYAGLGCAPRCGKCVTSIRRMVNESTREQDDAPVRLAAE